MSILKTTVLRLLGVLGTALLIGLSGTLYAQDNPVSQLQEQFEADSTLPSSSAKLVSADVRWARTPVPAGEETQAAVVLDVEEGWHVNAHEPTYDYLIGTQLDWTTVPDVIVERMRYPTPKQYHLQFAADTIDVYEGRAPIFLAVRPSTTAPPGERRLTGRLRVQACNDKTCLRPSTLEVSLPVPVAAAGVQAQSRNDPIFDAAPFGSRGGTLMALLHRHGLFLAGGLLVVLTIGGLALYGRLTTDSEGPTTDTV